MNVGDFVLAKVYIYHNHNPLDGKPYKFRPALIIEDSGKFVKCLTVTSILKRNDPKRIDIPEKYEFDKPSQLDIEEVHLIKKENIRKVISRCEPQDFNMLISRHKEIRDEKFGFSKDAKKTDSEVVSSSLAMERECNEKIHTAIESVFKYGFASDKGALELARMFGELEELLYEQQEELGVKDFMEKE